MIAVIALVAAAAAATYALLASERYAGEAKLLVVPPRDALVRRLAFPSDPETIAALVETPDVADRVAVRLNLSRDDVLDAIDARREGDSDVVVVQAEAATPTRAAQIANAFADEAIRERSTRFQGAVARETSLLRAELSDVPLSKGGERRERLLRVRALMGQRDPTVELAAAAVAAPGAVSPRPVPLVLSAALAGLLVGSVVAAALGWRPGRTAAEEPGRYEIAALERLVSAHPNGDADWQIYLEALREQARPDGTLPPSLDWLVEDVYGALVKKP